MEVSHTALQELVGIDQLALWLPTVVTLATLLLAQILAPVNLVHGVAVHQCVEVCSLPSLVSSSPKTMIHFFSVQ